MQPWRSPWPVFDLPECAVWVRAALLYSEVSSAALEGFVSSVFGRLKMSRASFWTVCTFSKVQELFSWAHVTLTSYLVNELQFIFTVSKVRFPS